MLNVLNMMKQAPLAPSERSRLDARFNKGDILCVVPINIGTIQAGQGNTVRGF
jgi:hypothetical protein